MMTRGTGWGSVLEAKLAEGKEIYFRCKVKRMHCGGFEYMQYIHIKSKESIMTFHIWLTENKPNIFRNELYPLKWSTVKGGKNLYYPNGIEWITEQDYRRSFCKI